jgi:hypothetical protein
MTEHKNHEGLKNSISKVNSLRIKLEKDCYNDSLKNIDAAIKKTNSEDFKKKLVGLYQRYQDKTIDLKKYDFRYNLMDKNIDQIINSMKLVKKEIAKGLYRTITEIKAYQDDIVSKKTLEPYKAELGVLHNASDPVKVAEDIINSKNNTPQAKAYATVIIHKYNELRIYRTLYEIFNKDESEYIKILQEYSRFSNKISNFVRVLTKPSQKEVQKILDKILFVINLCPDSINLKT